MFGKKIQTTISDTWDILKEKKSSEFEVTHQVLSLAH